MPESSILDQADMFRKKFIIDRLLIARPSIEIILKTHCMVVSILLGWYYMQILTQLVMRITNMTE